MTNEQLFLAEAVTDFLAQNDWLNERDMRTVSTLRHDYVCKYKRLGCIGCPMGTVYQRVRDFERYPKYKEQYIRCFDTIVSNRKQNGIEYDKAWETGQDVFEWWIRLNKNAPREQASLLEMEVQE